MNLENQVTPLELSKKLKELGVKQESLFYYHQFEMNGSKQIRFLRKKQDLRVDREGKERWVGAFNGFDAGNPDNVYSAFTVAELGELLPELCLSGKVSDETYNCWWFEDMLLCGIKEYNKFQSYYEVEARASMLIYLLENKLVEIK